MSVSSTRVERKAATCAAHASRRVIMCRCHFSGCCGGALAPASMRPWDLARHAQPPLLPLRADEARNSAFMHQASQLTASRAQGLLWTCPFMPLPSFLGLLFDTSASFLTTSAAAVARGTTTRDALLAEHRAALKGRAARPTQEEVGRRHSMVLCQRCCSDDGDNCAHKPSCPVRWVIALPTMFTHTLTLLFDGKFPRLRMQAAAAMDRALRRYYVAVSAPEAKLGTLLELLSAIAADQDRVEGPSPAAAICCW